FLSLLVIRDHLVSDLCISNYCVNDNFRILVGFLSIIVHPVNISKVFKLLYLVDQVNDLARDDLYSHSKVGGKRLARNMINSSFSPSLCYVNPVSMRIDLEARASQVISNRSNLSLVHKLYRNTKKADFVAVSRINTPLCDV